MPQKVTPLVNRYVVTAPESGAVVVRGAEAVRTEGGADSVIRRGPHRGTGRLQGPQGGRPRGATYDVRGAGGEPVRTFRKDVKASLLRSTWHLTRGDRAAVGKERSVGVPLARRA